MLLQPVRDGVGYQDMPRNSKPDQHARRYTVAQRKASGSNVGIGRMVAKARRFECGRMPRRAAFVSSPRAVFSHTNSQGLVRQIRFGKRAPSQKIP